MIDYSKKETGTRTLLLPSQNVSFPQISICHFNPFHSEELKKHGFKNPTEYMVYGKWTSNLDGVSTIDLFNSIHKNASNILKRATAYLATPINGSIALNLTQVVTK